MYVNCLVGTTKDLVQITPSSFDLNPIMKIGL